jgi:hypothetical protein
VTVPDPFNRSVACFCFATRRAQSNSPRRAKTPRSDSGNNTADHNVGGILRHCEREQLPSLRAAVNAFQVISSNACLSAVRSSFPAAAFLFGCLFRRTNWLTGTNILVLHRKTLRFPFGIVFLLQRELESAKAHTSESKRGGFLAIAKLTQPSHIDCRRP